MPGGGQCAVEGGRGGGPNPRKILPSLPHGSSVGGSIPLGSEQNLRTVGEGGGFVWPVLVDF